MRRRSCAASRTVVGSRGMMARSSDRACVPASTAAAAATASPTSSAATEATVARAWRRGTCGANAHISAGDSRATSAETTARAPAAAQSRCAESADQWSGDRPCASRASRTFSGSAAQKSLIASTRAKAAA